MPSRRRWWFVLAMSLLVPVSAASAQALPSIADKTKGLVRLEGFIPLYWDAAGGKLWMEIPRLGEDFLYVTGAPTGLGSNDIGLDRGQIGGERVVHFERVGNKVLLVQPNFSFRAVADSSPAARRAVEESFATSTLWGFRVEAETGGTLLVDATDFAMRDVHNVVGTLARTRQGTYRLDLSRSALYVPNTKVFPRNTEIETSLTFTGDPAGGWIRDVAPSAEAVTIRQRISLVALPEPGYEPRELDPRAGFFGVGYRDFTAPLGVDQTRQFIARHRLKKRNPGAGVSEPVRPIVYYLDRGAPEPIRSALLEGARWWNQAFEAAGYRNAFRVELLPEGADPMDVRYNMIQWVHRYTRGWSYGNTVTDPRTGEIIKGHVTLGSLRVRQDYMLAEGLLAPYRTGNERVTAAEAMALARLRQLAAHEVGHTLGIQHNYIASTANRASVMDYPHPVVALAPDGSIDLSGAYATGIGEWDKEVIKYGYTDLPGSDHRAALEAMLASARARGLHFLSDQDARPLGSAHPTTHLWDNGTDAVAELGRMLQVRRAALARFGEQAIQQGRPLATLEEVLVPLYLHHRYQVEAASKVIGGQYYTYAMRGDNQEPVRAVSAADQRRALMAVLQTISPRELAIPRSVLAKIPPRPSGVPTGEVFDKVTSPVFDALTPAAAAADMVAQLLFNPERAARLVQQHSLDTAQLGLVEVIDSILAVTSRSPGDDPYFTALGRAAQRVVVDRLIWLAATTRSPEVRSIANFRLRTLSDELAALPALRARERQSEAEGAAHLTQLMTDINRYLERPWDPQSLPRAFVPPPGSPIGDP